MKANRKFVQADEAVSPVIAVILMVAITVVLAATVFVLVSDIGGNTATSAPTISWTSDEGQDRLAVSTASQNADWNRLTVQIDGCSIATSATVVIKAGNAATNVVHSANAVTGGAPLNTGTAGTTCGAAAAKPVGTAADKIGAGEFIDFCAEGTGVSATNFPTNVKVTIKDTTANAVVHTYTFTDIMSICA